jgi:ketosteroid isomerase-like protein
MAGTFSTAVRVASLAALTLCLCGSRTPVNRKAPPDADQSAIATILHLEEALDQAETHHDVVTVAKLIASDYRGITVGGRIIERKDVLAAVNGNEQTSSQSTEREVRILENVAIYTALVVDHGVNDKTQEPYSLTTRVTDVWQKQGKEWKLVHDHESAVKNSQ